MPIESHERRATLRLATQELHTELDALSSSLELTSREGYCRFLLATAAPLIGLELALEASGVESMLNDWSMRRRRFRLALDLHDLALTATPLDARRAMSISTMFGVLYVLEGSRLGAQVLERRVAQSSDEAVRSARSFLRSGDAAFWLGYLRALENHGGIVENEMLEGARHAFGLFHGSFRHHVNARPRVDASPIAIA